MSLISKLFDTDIGIDLGASRTRVWIKGKGRAVGCHDVGGHK